MQRAEKSGVLGLREAVKGGPMTQCVRGHKKAEAIQKRGERFTKGSLFSLSYILFS